MKQILRKCIVSNEKYDKRELLRIVKQKDNTILIDPQQNILGRGCYIYPTKDNLTQAVKKKVLNRNFKTQVEASVYQQLMELINE